MQLKAGPANQSYGLQVASLAGVPAAVIRRAKKYLTTLEAQQVYEHPQTQLRAQCTTDSGSKPFS